MQGTILDRRGHAIRGAVEAHAELIATGIPVVFASNQTAVTRAHLAGQLRAEGFAVEDRNVVTTAHLTGEYLRDRHADARIAVFADRDPFAPGTGLNLVERGAEADVVVLTGAGPWLDHEALNAILRQLEAGAELVAMHRNLTWMDAGGLALDTGALLPGLEEASGRRAHVVGKPSADFFEQALAGAGILGEGALMVGDDVEADVLAAQRLGLTGVLVRTGKYRAEGLERAGGAPDHVIDSIADLTGLLDGGEER